MFIGASDCDFSSRAQLQKSTESSLFNMVCLSRYWTHNSGVDVIVPIGSVLTVNLTSSTFILDKKEGLYPSFIPC